MVQEVDKCISNLYYNRIQVNNKQEMCQENAIQKILLKRNLLIFRAPFYLLQA